MEHQSVLSTFVFVPLLTFSKLALSPWVALEYCDDSAHKDTWVCYSPESCGCEWTGALGLLSGQPRGCEDMGNDARVALYAPSQLAPYVSLPTSHGGSTGYFTTTTMDGTTTWVAVPKCTMSTYSHDKAIADKKTGQIHRPTLLL
jgi:hypothetical protein